MTAERPENQNFSPAAPDFHCFWGCANWISIIDLLIRLAAETGTMRILRGKGGVGGWVWTLFRLARKIRNPGGIRKIGVFFGK